MLERAVEFVVVGEDLVVESVEEYMKLEAEVSCRVDRSCAVEAEGSQVGSFLEEAGRVELVFVVQLFRRRRTTLRVRRVPSVTGLGRLHKRAGVLGGGVR